MVNLGLWKDVVGENLLYIIRWKGKKAGGEKGAKEGIKDKKARKPSLFLFLGI